MTIRTRHTRQILPCIASTILCLSVACTTPPEAEPPTEEATPTTPLPDAPELALDAPAQRVHLPEGPTWQFTVDAAGEYQIDATGGPQNPQLILLQDARILARDDNGGERLNARIITFLEPGTYQVRAIEEAAREMTIQLSAQRLSALESVGALQLGEDLAVTIPNVAPMRRNRHARLAARALTLTVDQRGRYACEASSPDADPEMALIHEGTQVATDSDGGEGRNARIEERLDVGTYRIRVWDHFFRGANMTVRCIALPGEAPTD